MKPTLGLPALIAAVAAGILLLGGSKRRQQPAGGGTGGGGPEGGTGPTRPRPGKDSVYTGGGLKGKGSADAIKSAMNALCTRPMNLTAAEQELLRSSVMDPLYDDYFGSATTIPEIDNALRSLAGKVLKDCAKSPHPESLQVAIELVRAVWWKRTGQTGQ